MIGSARPGADDVARAIRLIQDLGLEVAMPTSGEPVHSYLTSPPRPAADWGSEGGLNSRSAGLSSINPGQGRVTGGARFQPHSGWHQLTGYASLSSALGYIV